MNGVLIIVVDATLGHVMYAPKQAETCTKNEQK